MSTNALRLKDVKRQWHKIDAKDQILGRLASSVATILMGKSKSDFVPYLDNGDFVVVYNASRVKVTGKKMTDKVYFRHSGYPGGDKTETLSALLDRRPTEVLHRAIAGMLPKTKLGRAMIKKLVIYPGKDLGKHENVGEVN